MSHAHVLGFPRLGAGRELAVALERYWREVGTEIEPGTGADAEAALRQTGRALRARHWAMQREAGLDSVAVGDFAWHDHILQTLVWLGALPGRFGLDPNTLSLRQYFELARGNAVQPGLTSAPWWGTHYRYLVPEFDPDTPFCGDAQWLLDEVDEARAAGHTVKPVLIGPLTLLALGQARGGLAHTMDLLPRALQAYRRVLAALRKRGVEWVQLDEPIFALGLDSGLDPIWRDAAYDAYAALAEVAPKILLATYFGAVDAALPVLQRLPIAGLHIDLASAPQQLDAVVATLPAERVLSCGIVDGRNVWRHDLEASLRRLQSLQARLGERLWVAGSCSLLHVPTDLAQETKLDAELRGWLAFARQKCWEIGALKAALTQGRARVAPLFEAAAAACAARRTASRVHNQAVQRRVAAVDAASLCRNAPDTVRAQAQQARFNLPPLPTALAGALPPGEAVRQARVAFRQKRIGHLAYLETMRAEIDRALAAQQACGLDVLVHGAAEREDAIEFFAEQLWGYALTEQGWVQSHGAHCVKPPLLYGDVYAVQPITVSWSVYAQSRADRPVKGLLIGPVSLLQRAFVRDDQSLASTALQVALALRDEIVALEAAGIGMVQLDEPAWYDGLPAGQQRRADYLAWAVRAFRLAAGGAVETTQIHLYLGEAAHVVDGAGAANAVAHRPDTRAAIAALDADVVLDWTQPGHGLQSAVGAARRVRAALAA